MRIATSCLPAAASHRDTAGAPDGTRGLSCRTRPLAMKKGFLLPPEPQPQLVPEPQPQLVVVTGAVMGSVTGLGFRIHPRNAIFAKTDRVLLSARGMAGEGRRGEKPKPLVSLLQDSPAEQVKITGMSGDLLHGPLSYEAWTLVFVLQKNLLIGKASWWSVSLLQNEAKICPESACSSLPSTTYYGSDCGHFRGQGKGCMHGEGEGGRETLSEIALEEHKRTESMHLVPGEVVGGSCVEDFPHAWQRRLSSVGKTSSLPRERRRGGGVHQVPCILAATDLAKCLRSCHLLFGVGGGRPKPPPWCGGSFTTAAMPIRGLLMLSFRVWQRGQTATFSHGRHPSSPSKKRTSSLSAWTSSWPVSIAASSKVC